MFLKILKKDLIRKKTMNLIMLLFILLSGMFMGSSLNNLAVSTTSVDNFFNMANTADVVFIIAGNEDTFKAADDFFSARSDIKTFASDQSIMGMETNLFLENGDAAKLGNSDMGIYLTKNPKQYSKIYTTGNEFFSLKDGEIAIPNILAELIKVSVGDKLKLRFEDKDREYTVSTITKDAGFGTAMGATMRIAMADKDYDEVHGLFPVKVAFYHVLTDDVDTVSRAVSENITGLKTTVSKSLFRFCYLFDVMMAVIMLIVGICLLLVAFMILRFTIVFTLENDFKEIGVLKAVGIRNRPIRSLYLSKYLALSIIGSVIGCMLSFPFSSLLNDSLNKNIVASKTGGFSWINIFSALFVILVVVLYSYRCTKKLNKFSAIEAIRCGSKGESYRTKNRVTLHKFKKLPVSLSLALNDVTGSIRRYVVMVIIFFICLLLMSTPMVAVNTLSKPDIVISQLGMNVGGLYVYVPLKEIALKADREYLENYLYDMEKDISAAGYDVNTSTQAFLMCNLEFPDKSGEYSVYSIMDVNTDDSTVTAIDGSLCEYENEFMLSEQAMREFGGKIGDTYRMTFGEESYDMILTGIYNNMNNLGRSAHITNHLKPDFQQLGAISPVTVLFNEDLTKEEFDMAHEVLKKIYPDYSVYNSDEYAQNFMGSYIDMFNSSGRLVILIVMIVIFLVSLLMSKSFITRESGESALLKSIGFRNRDIRTRHILRIVICLALSLFVFYIVCVPLSNLIITNVFKLFGAYNVHAALNPVYIFLIYPAMVLADIILAGFIGTLSIKKVDPKEVNNAE